MYLQAVYPKENDLRKDMHGEKMLARGCLEIKNRIKQKIWDTETRKYMPDDASSETKNQVDWRRASKSDFYCLSASKNEVNAADRSVIYG